MNNQSTIQAQDQRVAQINDLIAARSRELTSRENADFSARPREVYKEENIKIHKEISRDEGEDRDEEQVSSSPTIGPDQRSAPKVVDFVSSPERIPVGQEKGVIVIDLPREHTSRDPILTYSGISVQHVRTRKGVKLAITLQSREMAEQGACASFTAELKRDDRLREIKSLEEDSDQFDRYLQKTKNDIRDLENRRNICLGRMHTRGRRSAWQVDCLVVAVMETDIIRTAYIYLEGEEYVISLDQELSSRQEKYYLSLGYHGQIAKRNRAPRLCEAPLRIFGA